MTRKVFIIGLPHTSGGAGGECWSAVNLWRKCGVEVTFVVAWPTELATPDEKLWVQKVTAAGCKIVKATQFRRGLSDYHDWDGQLVVAFCCAFFVYPDIYRILIDRGCQKIWIPTMCWSSDQEKKTFATLGLPETIVYQSHFQRHSYESLLMAGLLEHNFTGDPYDAVTSCGVLIRGAFDVENWPFQPKDHTLGQPFIIGKLAGERPEKWHPRLWEIYGKVAYPYKVARVMGVNKDIAKQMGRLPPWAHWNRQRTIPVLDYYRMLHAMAPINMPGTFENRPRVALESFACGVPLVAMADSGWLEICEHDETGFLATSDEEVAHWLNVLIYEPKRRKRIIDAARTSLARIANDDEIWNGWRGVFNGKCLDTSAPAA